MRNDSLGGVGDVSKGGVFELNQVTCDFKMNELTFKTIGEKSEIGQDNLNLVELLEKQSENKPKIEEETERSLFTHRKNMNVKEINSKISKSRKNQGEAVIQKKKIRGVTEGFAVVIPLEIVFCNKIHPIYYLLTSQGSGRNTINRLSYAGFRLTGREERRYLYHYSSELLYPYDYPGTEGYCRQTARLFEKNVEWYMLRPPSKRVNYQTVGSISPFYPNWKLISGNFGGNFSEFNSTVKLIEYPSNPEYLRRVISCCSDSILLVPIQFRAVTRGSFEENDMIYVPTAEDVDKTLNSRKVTGLNLIEMLKTSNRQEYPEDILESTDYCVIQSNLDRTDDNKRFNQDFKAIVEHGHKFSSRLIDHNFCFFTRENEINKADIVREPAGFTGLSMLDYDKGKYRGKGFISIRAYRDMLKLGGYCLIKPKRGTVMHLCSINTI